MNALGTLQYHLNVTVAGNAFLRWERFQAERALARPGFWKDPLLAPPLRCAPRLKELISRHYLVGRYANLGRKVAWVSSGAPVEFLDALGFYLLYPENHAVLCATRRRTEELAGVAEDAGYSRDLCSYARTDVGSVLSGKTPVGRLPKPDLLVCCDNICQSVLYWYRVLAHRFRVPLIVIDTPFIYSEPDEHAVDYVKRQIEQAIGVAEEVAGKSLDPKELEKISRRAKEAAVLWQRALQLSRHKPAPFTAFDQFIHMAPVVEMRGAEVTLEYYRTLIAELEEKAKRGEGAVANERIRLLWDNLPIWPRLRWLQKRLAERGAALVASTYTNAWAELTHLMDPTKPLDSAARAYLQPLLNRGTGYKLQVMQGMAKDYGVNGAILHSDRSCKPYSVGQMDQRERLSKEAGIPVMLLEADHADPRSFSEEQVANRLSAFLEVLEA